MPKSSNPASLEIQVISFVPFSNKAEIRFSGTPVRPKPPIRILEPEVRSFIASAACVKTLFILIIDNQ